MTKYERSQVFFIQRRRLVKRSNFPQTPVGQRSRQRTLLYGQNHDGVWRCEEGG